MSTHSQHTFPKLHNAMWPGLVGKGSPGAEPCIDLDTMLDLTAKAEVDGIRFDGVRRRYDSENANGGKVCGIFNSFAGRESTG